MVFTVHSTDTLFLNRDLLYLLTMDGNAGWPVLCPPAMRNQPGQRGLSDFVEATRVVRMGKYLTTRVQIPKPKSDAQDAGWDAEVRSLDTTADRLEEIAKERAKKLREYADGR